MFNLLRRISGSVLPRTDRPWADDATSNAPHTGRKRRLSSTDREPAQHPVAKKFKARSWGVADVTASAPKESPIQTEEAKEVKKPVEKPVLESSSTHEIPSSLAPSLDAQIEKEPQEDREATPDPTRSEDASEVASAAKNESSVEGDHATTSGLLTPPEKQVDAASPVKALNHVHSKGIAATEVEAATKSASAEGVEVVTNAASGTSKTIASAEEVEPPTESAPAKEEQPPTESPSAKGVKALAKMASV